MRLQIRYLLITLLGTVFIIKAQPVSKLKNVKQDSAKTYQNPVIHADYSDPDAIRVGSDYYMTASSFHAVPGLPILHSQDLVNWKIIGYALKKQVPEEWFTKVRHGQGVWAPSIRYHSYEFYIYYPDPDFGIYMIKAKKITGPWTEPVLVEGGKGLIDPCPLWDDNGKVYLVHAFAGSRAGIKSILVIKELNKEANKVTGNAVMVYDGKNTDPTVEGPKLYKRNKYYYIFAPAGGVATGWQLVLRSRNIYGPYERKIVMDHGTTQINGPHQGAWVQTKGKEDWFLHFQDKGAYGRIVHLQPMIWKNDWPVIGNDVDGDGKGEPVMIHKKPVKGVNHSYVMQDSDEFNTTQLGLQWQWQANPNQNWAFTTSEGFLRMFSVKWPDSCLNSYDLPSVLMQKIPSEEFEAIVKVNFSPGHEGERFGFIVLGTDHASISLVKKKDEIVINFSLCIQADKGSKETEQVIGNVKDSIVYLKIKMKAKAACSFSYSVNGISFYENELSFTARPGKWVGAKIGFFCSGINSTNNAGHADIDWIRITGKSRQ